ncbi:hypothetical protein [Curtobacterium sp. L1-20]|uniref:hypothetical protein n=1 Tax=Curtobacterium sp. L1-20 TaxID=3138181 RepID=UPI003B5222F6
MSTAALLVSCFSLVVSGLALGWQVAMWLLNGGRVRVRLMHGVIGHGGVAVGPVRRNNRLLDHSAMRAQGWNGPDVLGIEVTNTGRARIQVTGFGIRQGNKGMSVNYPSGNAISPALPAWIEPGSSVTWYGELADGTALIYATAQNPAASGPRELRMSVSLGTGKSVTTPQCVRI